MRPENCIMCGAKLIQPKTSKRLYCPECVRKRRVEQSLKAQKKKNPYKEVGVGSGNHSKNKNKPATRYTYRKKIKLKDACEICGSKENLLRHHKDHNRNNNNPDNIITLCKKCHQEHHTLRDPFTGRYLAQK